MASYRTIVPYAGSVPASTRRGYFSRRFERTPTLERIRCAWAPNCQRLLWVRIWYVMRPDIADNATPDGINILGDRGTIDYLSGDGNEVLLEVSRELSPGGYLLMDAYNTDTAVHTLDAQLVVSEVVY